MKRFVYVLIIFSFSKIYAQNGNNFNNVVDSTLVSISQLIKEDLAKKNITVLERRWIVIGEAHILEATCDNKTPYILSLLGVSKVKEQAFYKQNRPLRKKYIGRTIKGYTMQYGKLPDDIIEYLNFKFLLFAISKETFGDALYGEYKFKSLNGNLKIIDSRIEILNGEAEIIDKYNLIF